MLRCPTKDFGYGINNHYKPRRQLRRMRDLYAWVRAIRSRARQPEFDPRVPF